MAQTTNQKLLILLNKLLILRATTGRFYYDLELLNIKLLITTDTTNNLITTEASKSQQIFTTKHYLTTKQKLLSTIGLLNYETILSSTRLLKY